MSYDLTIARMSNRTVRVQVVANATTAFFDMSPIEARNFAFNVIEKANEIDHADLQAVNESGAK